MKGINWLGTIIGFVVAYLIGFLWYGVVFSRRWMELNGMNPDAPMEMSSADSIAMAVGALITLVQVVGLGILLARLQVRSWKAGGAWGLFVAIFFAITMTAMKTVYAESPFAPERWDLFALDAGYPFVFFPIAGAIIGGIGKREPRTAP